ncbi:hypothetical protein LCGC14_0378160 [marine sediment metagenome]|uniref:Uncharacterized protein n=1 Tax=marine sediment metagenome TaxID=412755 RepID=A0A0F9WBX6_9ZZZZ
MVGIQKEIIDLLNEACSQEPDQSILQVISSCFAEGDISHIDDYELRDNLAVLIQVNKERIHDYQLSKKRRTSSK